MMTILILLTMMRIKINTGLRDDDPESGRTENEDMKSYTWSTQELLTLKLLEIFETEGNYEESYSDND